MPSPVIASFAAAASPTSAKPGPATGPAADGNARRVRLARQGEAAGVAPLEQLEHARRQLRAALGADRRRDPDRRVVGAREHPQVARVLARELDHDLALGESVDVEARRRVARPAARLRADERAAHDAGRAVGADHELVPRALARAELELCCAALGAHPLHPLDPQLRARLARALEQERVEHAAREDLDRRRQLDRHAAAARREEANRVRGPRSRAQLRELRPARERAGGDSAAAGLLARVRRVVQGDPVPGTREPPGAERARGARADDRHVHHVTFACSRGRRRPRAWSR